MVKVKWYRDNNFGDQLTPLFLRKKGIKSSYAHIKSADLIGIGSLLTSNTTEGTIWTTGVSKPVKELALPNAKIIAVRGKHTLARIKPEPTGEVILGDGGLIIPYLFPPTKEEKKYLLGIIPHYIDREWILKNLEIIHQPEVLLINIRDKPETIIQQVQHCQYVISSSLHGLILADSYRIPNIHFNVPTSARITGGNFKFSDYYSVFDLPDKRINLKKGTSLNEIIEGMKDYHRPNLKQIQEKLYRSFNQITARWTQNIYDMELLSHADTYKSIDSYLKQGKRLFHLRFNDGEYLSYHADKPNPNLQGMVNKKQWGYRPTPAERKRFAEEMKETMPLLTHLGLDNSIHPKVMKRWDFRKGEDWQLQYRTSSMWHRYYLDEEKWIATLKEWFSQFQHIGIVASYPEVVEVLRKAYPEKKIAYLQTPREEHHGKNNNSFPNVEKRCDQLKELVIPGSLWLVSAGIHKFIYGRVIYQAGGNVVDTGKAINNWDKYLTAEKLVSSISI